MLSVTLISLTACSSVIGNVVPKTGPSMEQVYDSMSKQNNATDSIADNESDAKTALQDFREEKIRKNTLSREFRKLPNPELQMYIYPHLAGRDQIPVPGYTTVFNVYERDHYEI